MQARTSVCIWVYGCCFCCCCWGRCWSVAWPRLTFHDDPLSIVQNLCLVNLDFNDRKCKQHLYVWWYLLPQSVLTDTYQIGKPKPSTACIIFYWKLWNIILVFFRLFWPAVGRLSFASLSTIRLNYSLASGIFYVTLGLLKTIIILNNNDC